LLSEASEPGRLTGNRRIPPDRAKVVLSQPGVIEPS
jgi:hypothetical protein